MSDVYEVGRGKERAVVRVVRDIRALRLAVSLLSDGTDIGPIPAVTRGDRGTAEAQRPRLSKVLQVAHTVTDDAGCGGTKATGEVKLRAATKISSRLKRLANPVAEAVGWLNLSGNTG